MPNTNAMISTTITHALTTAPAFILQILDSISGALQLWIENIFHMGSSINHVVKILGISWSLLLYKAIVKFIQNIGAIHKPRACTVEGGEGLAK